VSAGVNTQPQFPPETVPPDLGRGAIHCAQVHELRPPISVGEMGGLQGGSPSSGRVIASAGEMLCKSHSTFSNIGTHPPQPARGFYYSYRPERQRIPDDHRRNRPNEELAFIRSDSQY